MQVNMLSLKLIGSLFCDVDVGEVVGLHTALQWIIADLQFDHVDFALDSKKVVDHSRSDVENTSEFFFFCDI